MLNHISCLQLEKMILQLEIIENGNFAYAPKWSLDAQVESAKPQEELDAILIEFVGKDFSSKEWDHASKAIPFS